MFLGVAPILHVDTEAVRALIGQQVEALVAQPVFSFGLTEAVSIFRPTPVKAHRTVTPPLKYRPAPTWHNRNTGIKLKTVLYLHRL